MDLTLISNNDSNEILIEEAIIKLSKYFDRDN